jgi:AraC-like DNA-binding protein
MIKSLVAAMLEEHQNLSLFQTLGNQINLDIPHAVLVAQRTPIQGINTIPLHRIYAVTKTGRNTSFIRNCDTDERIDLEVGGTYFMPASVPLEYSFEPGLRQTAFHFTIALESSLDLFHGQTHFDHKTDRLHLTDNLRLQLTELTKPGAMVRARGILMEIIAEFMAHSTTELHTMLSLRAKYAPLFDRVEEACTARLRVSELAQCMTLTPSALARNFRRDVGTTVKSFVSQRLVQRASHELLVSSRSIKEIAYDLEFPNEFYFSRFFKKHTNMSPSSFRRIYS